MCNVGDGLTRERDCKALDVLRAVAAVAVLAHHVKLLFFVNVRDAHMPQAIARPLYFVTGLGHEAVMVFFTLSGFLISRNVTSRMAAGRWSWFDYSTRRIARIYTVLIPALLLTAGVDAVGLWLFGSAGTYGNHPSNFDVVAYDVRAQYTLATFLGNAANLQRILCTTFGSNGPLWSLSFEFWYYFIFPCLFLGLRSQIAPWKRVAFLLSGGALLSFVGREVALYFGIWLLGYAVWLLPRGPAPTTRASRALDVAAIVILVAALVLSRARVLPRGAPADYVTGVACAFLLHRFLVSDLFEGWARGRVGSKLARLADSSYTLYLTHFPLLVFIQAALVARGFAKWQPTDPFAIFVCSVMFFGSLALAHFLARHTERHTDVVRQSLERSVSWLRVRERAGAQEPPPGN